MARLLLMSHAAKGHVNPMLEIARRLVQGGHTVAWLPRHIGPLTAEPSLPGVDVLPLDWSWLPPGEELDFTSAARDFGKFIENNREQRLNSTRTLVPRVREAIRTFAPDLLVIDGQVYAGVIAAYLERLPFIGILTSPAFLVPDYKCELTLTLDVLSEERTAIFHEYGIEPVFAAWDCLSPVANFVLTLPELIGERVDGAPNVELAGPSICFDRADNPPDFPWDRLDRSRPLVYVSFGTVWYKQPDLFLTVAKAADILGLQTVAAVGTMVDNDVFVRDLPASTLAVRYAPQLEVLQRAAVCVTHGGANTVTEALYFGVPQLVVPLCTDQPINSHLVVRNGAGISIPPTDLTVETCRQALAQLSAPDSLHRAIAERLHAAAVRQDGAARVVDRILQFLN